MKFFNMINKKAQFKKYIEGTLHKKSVAALQQKRQDMTAAKPNENVQPVQ